MKLFCLAGFVAAATAADEPELIFRSDKGANDCYIRGVVGAHGLQTLESTCELRSGSMALTMTEKFDEVHVRLTDLNSRVSSIEAAMATQGVSMSTLQAAITDNLAAIESNDKDIEGLKTATPATPDSGCWEDTRHGAWSGAGQGAQTHPWFQALPYNEANLKLAKIACHSNDNCLGVWWDNQRPGGSKIYTGSRLANEYWGWADYAGPPNSPSTRYFSQHKSSHCGDPQPCYGARHYGAWSGAGAGASTHPWLPFKLPNSEANMKLAKSACADDDRCLGVWSTIASPQFIYTGSSIASEYWGWSDKAGPPASPSTAYFAWKKKASC